jgi:predicted RNA-binding protein with PIN domain
VRWLVDGMNVIGSRPDGWWKDRHGAMVRLVEQLERLTERTSEEVAVVFERRPSPPIESRSVEVAHAPAAKPDSADDEIIRRLGAEPHPEEVTVVTSDARLAKRARVAGASVQGASAFRTELDGPPASPRSSRHRSAPPRRGSDL